MRFPIIFYDFPRSLADRRATLRLPEKNILRAHVIKVRAAHRSPLLPWFLK
jgi:hypothetical protein